jgi:hypothetical protein
LLVFKCLSVSVDSEVDEKDFLKMLTKKDESPLLPAGGLSMVSTFACSHKSFERPFGTFRRVTFDGFDEFWREKPIAVSIFSVDIPVAADMACDVTSLTLRSMVSS